MAKKHISKVKITLANESELVLIAKKSCPFITYIAEESGRNSSTCLIYKNL